jgi:hypothetical protein
MGVAVVTEAAADTAVSAAEDTRVSAAAATGAELVVATAEPGSVGLAAAMARGITHPEPRRDATAAMGKGTMHREARPETRFTVPAREHKVEPLPSSLLGRQSILVATTSRKIDPRLVLRVSPPSTRVIMRGQIGTYASSARLRLQKVQPGPTTLGLDRI